MTGIALAADEFPKPPDIIDPDIRPNDGGIQAYCDENYAGTIGIVFSTGSATTNSQGELTKTEAGYTLTWIESTDASPSDYVIAVLSITEAGDLEPLPFHPRRCVPRRQRRQRLRLSPSWRRSHRTHHPGFTLGDGESIESGRLDDGALLDADNNGEVC